VVERDRTARKIPGDFRGHNRRAVALNDAQRFHRVLILFPGRGIPIPDGVSASEGAAFIAYDAIINEAVCERERIAGCLRCEVFGDGLREIQRRSDAPSTARINVRSSHGKNARESEVLT